MNTFINHDPKNYFWLTHQQQEIDLLREKNTTFDAYEFKCSPTGRIKLPNSFIKEYKAGSFYSPPHQFTTSLVHQFTSSPHFFASRVTRHDCPNQLSHAPNLM